MTCEAAADSGYLEMLQWLRSKRCPWNERTFEAAALSGHLEILQWLHNQGCRLNEDTCIFDAAQSGHLGNG